MGSLCTISPFKYGYFGYAKFRGYYFGIFLVPIPTKHAMMPSSIAEGLLAKTAVLPNTFLRGKKCAPRWHHMTPKPRKETQEVSGSEKYQPKVIQCRVDANLLAKLSHRVRGSTLQPSALCCLWPITESISQPKAQIDSRPLQFWEDLP